MKITKQELKQIEDEANMLYNQTIVHGFSVHKKEILDIVNIIKEREKNENL